MRILAGRVGANIHQRYVCEPRPRMWQPDPIRGYANRPGFFQRVFGNVVGRTNSAGFRGQEEIPLEKEPGTYRVFCVGDSVTWGMRVSQEDTFVARLGRLLEKQHARVEAVNAGVVGYSTYQERLFLEQRLLAYHPDVVIVNFCENDLLPTEDPFDNARALYLDLLDRLRRGQGPRALTPRETEVADRLERILREAEQVWHSVKRSGLDPRSLDTLLIELPILEMAALAQEHGVRLVYALIPTTHPTAEQRLRQAAMGAFLRRAGVEVVDLTGALDGGARPSRSRRRPPPPNRWVSWASRQGTHGPLGWLNPLPSLWQIRSWRAERHRHRESDYADDIGHLSERGHAVVAEHLFRALTSR